MRWSLEEAQECSKKVPEKGLVAKYRGMLGEINVAGRTFNCRGLSKTHSEWRNHRDRGEYDYW